MVEDGEKSLIAERDRLAKVIYPEELLTFAHQCFLASEFFLWKWGEWADLHEEREKSEVAQIMIDNVCRIRLLIMEPADDYRNTRGASSSNADEV